MTGGHLLAIDGGQTSTKALLAAPDGTVLGHGIGGPSDHFHSAGGVARNRVALQGAIAAAYAAAGLEPGVVGAVAVGSTGVHDSAAEGPVVDLIVREVVSPGAVIVRPDYVTNLLGASGGSSGVVVIAGGGAIAYGRSDDGREVLSGGFGYLIGDEGSAFDIGRRAIIAAARASDGRDTPTALQQVVQRALNLQRMRDVTRVVYGEGFGREQIAALAPAVAAAAVHGDVVARAIMTSAGQELARMALACAGQLYPPHTPVPIYLTGGVFNAGELVLDSLRAVVLTRWPEAQLRSPLYPPVIGALALARQATGAQADGDWLGRVWASLNK